MYTYMALLMGVIYNQHRLQICGTARPSNASCLLSYHATISHQADFKGQNKGLGSPSTSLCWEKS